jgi:SecD/SecF fusion protein
MEKQRKWQFLLILAVVVLTVYNILPTVFYYLKPLKDPVSSAAAEAIAESLVKRLDDLEKGTVDWLHSYCELIRVKPLSVSIDPENRQLALVAFAKEEEARRLRGFLPRAGSLIPFGPAQLSVPPQDESAKEVIVQRKIPVRFESQDFSYLPKHDPRILDDRMEKIALVLAGPSVPSLYLGVLQPGNAPFPVIEALASEVLAIAETFGDESGLGARYAARFTQGKFADKNGAIQNLALGLDEAISAIRKEKSRLKDLEDEAQNLALLEKKEKSFEAAKDYLKKHSARFAAGMEPWSGSQIRQSLKSSHRIDLAEFHPFFSELSVDLQKDRIVLKFKPEAEGFRFSGKNKERFERLVVDELARVGREALEDLIPGEAEVAIPLHRLSNPSGYLVLDQKKLAERVSKQLQASLKFQWRPSHPDLAALPIVDFSTYQTLPVVQKALCLVVASPLISQSPDLDGMQSNSIYIAAKGIEKIAKHYELFPDSELASLFKDDFRRLAEILQWDGFAAYPGSARSTFAGAGDFLFEKPNFTASLLAGSREDFIVRGMKEMAVIELGDVEQRIAAENKIETEIHEDLLKWKDEYRTAQVSIDPKVRFDVPKPAKGAFWNNILLSVRKYWRGDTRKIIRWGLDLSGGKSIQIELLDASRLPIADDAALKTGINELYNRVNKMGVSEVSIRQVGHQIVLDFPGSQSMSASELIKASTMYFHVVNEQFSPSNPALGESVNRFLQEIWNEATVTGRKDPESLNAIAYKHLHTQQGEIRSRAAETLWENGLRLSEWSDRAASSALETDVSKIVCLRGKDFTEWQNQTHPLMIVFRNWAIEGAHLENIHAGYDPAKGNFLSFDVASSVDAGGKKIHPREPFYAWTSRYSKDKVLGSPLEKSSRGRGWRMAVLLNDAVISSPTLDAGLQTSAMISGNFTQREVNRLAADLKAGSLTYTPQILSEKNVSPELGARDRMKGITATAFALILVIGAMVAYYRFGGLVASIAVLFNLLILWATLQNLGASLTLAGLAAVILTVGMAVDANVLVFERIKEEFAESGNIRSALSAGYKKAYSAIIDSNVTTIIAALILLNFDAGPIKSFAVNLIIGIASSMFTALFMTRFYFTGWAQNPKNTRLKMSNWLRSTDWDFLKKAKLAFVISFAIIAVGGALLVAKRNSIFGMDFTGGYALNLELQATGAPHYVEGVEKALIAAGAAPSDFQIRELDPKNHLRILFGTSLEEPNKPFHAMPIENANSSVSKNPRIEWLVGALHKEGIVLSPQSLSQIDSNWTAMSGQMSDSMRNNALIGLAVAFIAIFIYLALRFEYKFAAAALVCLFHDVLITLGALGLLRFMGLAIQIDLNTIAALMTIIGYSLNDTIIIFDRIREEMRTPGHKKLTEIVNFSLNATLSRTTITSGTTLLVLIALVLFGGPSIFGFALVMTIGVFFGTMSSWFIASPLMIFFQRREEGKPVASHSS